MIKYSKQKCINPICFICGKPIFAHTPLEADLCSAKIWNQRCKERDFEE